MELPLVVFLVFVKLGCSRVENNLFMAALETNCIGYIKGLFFNGPVNKGVNKSDIKITPDEFLYAQNNCNIEIINIIEKYMGYTRLHKTKYGICVHCKRVYTIDDQYKIRIHGPCYL